MSTKNLSVQFEIFLFEARIVYPRDFRELVFPVLLLELLLLVDDLYGRIELIVERLDIPSRYEAVHRGYLLRGEKHPVGFGERLEPRIVAVEKTVEHVYDLFLDVYVSPS